MCDLSIWVQTVAGIVFQPGSNLDKSAESIEAQSDLHQEVLQLKIVPQSRAFKSLRRFAMTCGQDRAFPWSLARGRIKINKRKTAWGAQLEFDQQNWPFRPWHKNWRIKQRCLILERHGTGSQGLWEKWNCLLLRRQPLQRRRPLSRLRWAVWSQTTPQRSHCEMARKALQAKLCGQRIGTFFRKPRADDEVKAQSQFQP